MRACVDFLMKSLMFLSLDFAIIRNIWRSFHFVSQVSDSLA